MIEHSCEVKQFCYDSIKATCSCGSWLVVRAEYYASIVKAWTLNRVCVATDLVWRRFKEAQAA